MLRKPHTIVLTVLVFSAIAPRLVYTYTGPRGEHFEQLRTKPPDWISANYEGLVAAMQRDSYSWTPLMIAAAGHDNPDMISTLIGLGQSVAARSLNGWTALMFAAAFNPEPEVVAALLDAKADPDERSRDAWAALLGAARYTGENLRFDDISLAGVGGSPRGWTPLFFAARFNTEPRVVELLITAGADPAARDEHGRTPVFYARRHNPSDAVIERLEALEKESGQS